MYQLDDFAVLGKLNQGPNSEMGRIRVSLYDDSMKEILRIIWRDCWAASAKTQIRTIYKDVNGNTHAASPGYIYGDVSVDARMWYQESTETIKSTIDGMTATHASAADPERFVKYMVIQGHRYQGNSLIDLRIKDINVKVDLNAENPNAPEPGEPVEYDGTTDGKTASGEFTTQTSYMEQKFSEVNDMISVYWTGPWPKTHLVIQKDIIADVSVSIHITVDILGTVALEGFNIEFLGLEDMSESEGDQLVYSLQSSGAVVDDTTSSHVYLLRASAVLFAAAKVIATFAPPGSVHAEIAFWATLALAIGTVVAGLVAFAHAVWKSQVSATKGAVWFLAGAVVALATLLVMGWTMNNDIGTASGGASKIFRFFGERYQQGQQWERIGLEGRTHFGLMLYQLVTLVTIIVIAVGFFVGWVNQWFQ